MSESTFHTVLIGILTLWTLGFIALGVGVAYLLARAKTGLDEVNRILVTTRRTTQHAAEPVDRIADTVNSVADSVQAVADEVKAVFTDHTAPVRR